MLQFECWYRTIWRGKYFLQPHSLSGFSLLSPHFDVERDFLVGLNLHNRLAHWSSKWRSSCCYACFTVCDAAFFSIFFLSLFWTVKLCILNFKQVFCRFPPMGKLHGLPPHTAPEYHSLLRHYLWSYNTSSKWIVLQVDSNVNNLLLSTFSLSSCFWLVVEGPIAVIHKKLMSSHLQSYKTQYTTPIWAVNLNIGVRVSLERLLNLSTNKTYVEDLGFFKVRKFS